MLFRKRRGPATRGRTRLGMDTLEDRAVPAGLNATYAVTQDWGSGFQAEVRLTNDTGAAVDFQNLAFTLPGSITSLWDAKIVSHTGTTYRVTNAGWNTTIPAGGSVTFGFVGSGPSDASNFTLNGVSLEEPDTPTVPVVSVADVSVVESNAGTTDAVFVVSLSEASATPVTVRYATGNGTAQAGSDFTAAAGTLTFTPGETTKTIRVSVTGDTTVEASESFTLTLTSPTGATLGRAAATGTITNDDTNPTGGTLTFQVLSDWGSGFTGQITLTNPGRTPLSDWAVAFDLPASITSLWNGSITSHTGTRYVVGPAEWNRVVPAGGSVTIGFTVGTSGVSATNLELVSGDIPPPPANRAPTAADDATRINPDQAARISVLANDSDPDGDTLTLLEVGGAAHGTLTRNADGTITYTPFAGFTGTDNFTYTVSDGRGGTATGTVTITVAAVPTPEVSSWPAQVFAPYVDATLWPTYDFVEMARTQGTRFFTLAFVVAGPQKQPAWGGYAEYAVNGSPFDMQMRSRIEALRALGGDVAVSFGGASGQELAQVLTDVNALAAAYRSVIEAYGLTHIDFDIEGAAAADRASIDRRSQAIALLQAEAAAAGRELHVRYTLPVLPTGLTPDGVNVLQSAKAFGVRLDVVNIMAMDYGDSAAPNPAGRMGDYAIQAGQSLFQQLTQVFGDSTTDAERWRMVGITPMIGLNDVITETFDQQEARELLAWAEAKGIGLLSMWSVNRDYQNPAGAIGYVDLNSSSIVQSPLEFSTLFNTFTG